MLNSVRIVVELHSVEVLKKLRHEAIEEFRRLEKLGNFPDRAILMLNAEREIAELTMAINYAESI